MSFNLNVFFWCAKKKVQQSDFLVTSQRNAVQTNVPRTAGSNGKGGKALFLSVKFAATDHLLGGILRGDRLCGILCGI